jgi:hypothetical protein
VYQDPNWDWRTFELERDSAKAHEIDKDVDELDPHLAAFAEHGGKLLIYHGWADQQVAPGSSIEFYKSVMSLSGPEKSSTILQNSCSIVLMVQPRQEASRRLFDLAEQQQGYFTTKQAKAAGFAENTHPYHVQAGNWVREHRGIYRLALFPVTDRPDLALWSLWSKNRKEEVEGVYSHQTAISLHELSDLNPARLHMTVPTNFRRNSEIPGVLILHHGNLTESDIQSGPGYQYTRPLRTIIDLIEAGTVERNFIRQAVRQAVDRGLITRQQIQKATMSEPARGFIEEAISRATK